MDLFFILLYLLVTPFTMVIPAAPKATTSKTTTTKQKTTPKTTTPKATTTTTTTESTMVPTTTPGVSECPTTSRPEETTEDPDLRKDQSPKMHDPWDEVVLPPDYCAKIYEKDVWDFIVVGSGPAGSTVARRLAENPQHKVLLLEAGGDPPPEADLFNHNVPMTDSQVWSMKAEPSKKYCLGFPDERCPFRLAKVLGGSSITNAMSYLRGNQFDLDSNDDIGLSSWNYKAMLPYYKKLENFSAPTDQPEYHGTEGPLSVNLYPPDPYTYHLRRDFLQAVDEIGMPLNMDLNGASQIGFGIIPGTIESTGYRESIIKAYLLNLPDNIKVCKFALVTKLKINTEKTVEGIEVVYTGGGDSSRTLNLVAQKDYILSAGAINTPQILERSGIGRKEILEKAGVKLIHELIGVGEHFQERLVNHGSSFVLTLANSVVPNPLSAGLWDLVGFVNLTDPNYPIPDVSIHWSTPYNAYKPDILEEFKNISENELLIHVSPGILKQIVHGNVHINQTDPNIAPILNLNLYTSPRRLDIVVNSTRLVRKLLETKSLARYKPRKFILKTCADQKIDSDEEIMCHAYQLLSPLHQYAGTARMGNDTDKEAVVDEKLKVRGIKGLRIVDLSVLRKNPRSETEISAIALAEKAADIIKADWANEKGNSREKETNKWKGYHMGENTEKGKNYGKTTEKVKNYNINTEKGRRYNKNIEKRTNDKFKNNRKFYVQVKNKRNGFEFKQVKNGKSVAKSSKTGNRKRYLKESRQQKKRRSKQRKKGRSYANACVAK